MVTETPYFSHGERGDAHGGHGGYSHGDGCGDRGIFRTEATKMLTEHTEFVTKYLSNKMRLRLSDFSSLIQN